MLQSLQLPGLVEHRVEMVMDTCEYPLGVFLVVLVRKLDLEASGRTYVSYSSTLSAPETTSP